MSDGIDNVAARANSVAGFSQQTRSAAEQGARAVDETTAAMNSIQSVVGQAASAVQDLGKLTDRIGAVVETIDDIAEQTTLLALNAAIAVHAPTVADDVRCRCK